MKENKIGWPVTLVLLTKSIRASDIGEEKEKSQCVSEYGGGMFYKEEETQTAYKLTNELLKMEMK